MATILILLYLVKIPFLTGPISSDAFPVVLEDYIDTASAPVLEGRSPLSWPSPHEMVESLNVSRDYYSVSSWILDGEGYIQEKQRFAGPTDTLLFTERFEYVGREMRHWQGREESADCYYVGGRLDSVLIVNTDSLDAETYYFKLGYDPLGRLSRVDRVTLLPAPAESPLKRWVFAYGEDGVATLETSRPLGTSAPRFDTLIFAGDRLTEDRARLVSYTGVVRERIQHFVYPAGIAIRRIPPRRPDRHAEEMDAVDLLGRQSRLNHLKSAFTPSPTFLLPIGKK
jgi:hypothetical protein